MSATHFEADLELEIVPPRTPSEFRELKNYAASMQPRRECEPLRQDGFINGSAVFRNLVGY